MTDLIDTTEMYLKAIYELEEEGIPPMRARIAERLDHSGPTVSQTAFCCCLFLRNNIEIVYTIKRYRTIYIKFIIVFLFKIIINFSMKYEMYLNIIL